MELDREDKKKMADILMDYLVYSDYVPDSDKETDYWIEQLEIKHSYNDMDELYWFYDGE